MVTERGVWLRGGSRQVVSKRHFGLGPLTNWRFRLGACGIVATTLIGCGSEPSSTEPEAGTPTRLSFVRHPPGAAAGMVLAPRIEVAIQDGSGRTVADGTATVTVALGENPGGAILLGTTAVPAVSGIAGFSDLVIERAARGYTLVATSTGLTGATSEPFQIGPAAATGLAFVGQPATAGAGLPIPNVRVAVLDRFGNTVTGARDQVTMSLGPHQGEATLSGTLTVSSIQGIARFDAIRVDRPGSGYTLVVSAGSLGGATSTPFSVTAPTVGTLSNGGGGEHTCALTSGGTAYCWGSDYYGQLGAGGVSRRTPVAVAGGLTFTALTTNGSHTCGVTSQGAAYCWGLNHVGQVGDGVPRISSSTPSAVAGELGFATLTAGNEHTCGLTSAGEAYCWGGNGAGQLGDGTTTNRNTPAQVASGPSFMAMSAGGAHTCGLTSAGDAYCWGYNATGQLGDGSTASSSAPVAVAGGLSFATLSGGRGHSCALTAGGAAYCWGDNRFGQLGDGSTTDSSTPVPVAGGLSFVALSAGTEHTCAIAATGTAYCWGDNGSGRLGDGSTTDSSTPVAVAGGLSFAALGMGSKHTCGSTPAGMVYCWGSNWWGQLGDGSPRLRTTPLEVAGGIEFSMVTAGSSHTCGVIPEGAARCWGSNVYGQLGDGSTTDRATPVVVAGDLPFQSLSAGQFHTCGLTAAGEAYCWGANHVGQLGDGSTTSSAAPVAVMGGLTFSALRAGSFHTCGLSSTGAAYCWGFNDYGQLGDGSTTYSSTPRVVAGAHTFAGLGTSGGGGGVFAGGNHTCAWTATGVAFCWGLNSFGQLGDGSTSTTHPGAPVAVAGGLSFASLSTGLNHTCGLTPAGKAYCWGWNQDAQTGKGSLSVGESTPVAVVGGLTFSMLSAGALHSCAVTPVGAAYCWGGHTIYNLLGHWSFTPIAVGEGIGFEMITLGTFHVCGRASGGRVLCWGAMGSGALGDGTKDYREIPARVQGF